MKTNGVVQLASGLRIGQGQPCFIVAEMGNNHQGDIQIARDMIHAAAECQVQGVKFQKRDMHCLFTREGREAPYTGAFSFGSTYGEHRNALELDIEAMAELKELSEKLGLVFFASVWDDVSLAQIASLDVELIKLGSADLVNVPLLRKVGALNVAAILSTGMSTLAEVDLAVRELAKFHQNIVLLHCNSSYPCPESDIALPVIHELRRRYGYPVGYSGHERGLGASVAAVALGACMVERHFTLDKTWRGTDHQVSLEPKDFTELVKLVREAEMALTVSEKMVFPSEVAASKKLRKSIVFSRDLPAGHVLAEADLAVKCPGTGVSPTYWDHVIGSVLKAPVKQDQLFDWEKATFSSSAARMSAMQGKTVARKSGSGA